MNPTASLTPTNHIFGFLETGFTLPMISSGIVTANRVWVNLNNIKRDPGL